MFVALVLTGCASVERGPGSGDPPFEPEYKRIVAANIPAMFKVLPDRLDIAPLRPAGGSQPGDWITCLRASAKGSTAFYAVFVGGHRVVDWRRDVILDDCRREQVFEPLPFSPPAPTVGPLPPSPPQPPR